MTRVLLTQSPWETRGSRFIDAERVLVESLVVPATAVQEWVESNTPGQMTGGWADVEAGYTDDNAELWGERTNPEDGPTYEMQPLGVVARVDILERYELGRGTSLASEYRGGPPWHFHPADCTCGLEPLGAWFIARDVFDALPDVPLLALVSNLRTETE